MGRCFFKFCCDIFDVIILLENCFISVQLIIDEKLVLILFIFRRDDIILDIFMFKKVDSYVVKVSQL